MEQKKSVTKQKIYKGNIFWINIQQCVKTHLLNLFWLYKYISKLNLKVCRIANKIEKVLGGLDS